MDFIGMGLLVILGLKMFGLIPPEVDGAFMTVFGMLIFIKAIYVFRLFVRVHNMIGVFGLTSKTIKEGNSLLTLIIQRRCSEVFNNFIIVVMAIIAIIIWLV